MNNWLSIIPFVIAVLVAVLSRQVLFGLALGLLTGCFAIARSPIPALARFADYVISAIADRENLRVIFFLFVFGGLVGMMQVAGGIRGFARLVGKYARSQRSILALAWASIVVTFMDCEFRIMTVGPLMKAVRGKNGAMTAKIAYAMDVSTVPIIALLPVATTYAGYMVSVVGGALAESGVRMSAYGLFVASLAFNFYSFAILAIGLSGALTGRYIGRGIASASSAQAEAGDDEGAHRQSIEDELASVKPRPLNFIAPLLLLLASTFYLIWRDGIGKGAATLGQAMQRADATQMMLLALLGTTFITAGYYLLHREPLSEIMFHFLDGGNQLMMAILLLVLVWALSSLARDLGLAGFVAATIGFLIPRWLVPAAVFAVGSALAYFIGSSWGAWGILMPLAISIAVATGASLPATVGAVFASGCFGDFTSPLGETTITTSAVLNLPAVAYARAKLPSSLLAAILATLAFVIIGLRV